MEVRLFLVYEEGIGHPYVFDEFRTYGKGFHARPFSKGQPGICPELPEVEIQGEILMQAKHNISTK